MQASTDEEMINSQKETFGISSFIENANKYTGEFFEGIDINSMLNSAIKGNIDNKTIYKNNKSIRKEVKTGIKA